MDVEYIKRVKINDEFLGEEFTINDFEDSLIIFDDIDVITDKKKKGKLVSLLGMILETGRHARTSCIYTSHIACAGHESKRILNECHAIVFFQRMIPRKKIEYLLETYTPMDKEQRDAVIGDISSRWTCIIKTYPIVVMRQCVMFIPEN
jgi:hypothetical protein